MKKLLSFVAILTGSLILAGPFAFSTPQMASKEKVSCVTCHTGVGREELNDTGKCYKKNEYSLKNCPLPKAP